MVVPASSLLGFCGLVGSVSEPVITPPLLCVPFIWLGLPGKPPLLELSVLSTALTTFIASTSPAFLIIWTVCSWLAWTTFLLSIYEWENIGLIITLRSKSCTIAQKGVNDYSDQWITRWLTIVLTWWHTSHHAYPYNNRWILSVLTPRIFYGMEGYTIYPWFYLTAEQQKREF